MKRRRCFSFSLFYSYRFLHPRPAFPDTVRPTYEVLSLQVGVDESGETVITLAGPTVPTYSKTWGAIKALYR